MLLVLQRILDCNNYQVYSGKNITQQQFDALVEDIRTSFVQDQKFITASDRTKQQIYEEAAIMGTYVIVAQDIAQQTKDPKKAALLRDTAKQALESFFEVPANKLRLSDRGVEFL